MNQRNNKLNMVSRNFISFVIILFLSYVFAEHSDFERKYKYAVDDIHDIFFKIEPTKYKYYQNSQIPNFDFSHKYIAEEQECFEYCDKDVHCKWINLVIDKSIGHCWLSKPLTQKGVDTYIKISHNNYICWNNTDIKGLDIFSQHADSPSDCIKICDDDQEHCQFFNIKNEENDSYICYFKKLQTVSPNYSMSNFTYFVCFILVPSIIIIIMIMVKTKPPKKIAH